MHETISHVLSQHKNIQEIGLPFQIQMLTNKKIVSTNTAKTIRAAVSKNICSKNFTK